MTENSLTAIFGDVIHSYGRAEAIADGTLIDVTDRAYEIGFRIPVALTAGAWHDCVEWTQTDADEAQCHQDEVGRLWDVLNVARAACSSPGDDTVRLFEVRRIERQATGALTYAKLKVVIGPGDDPAPVITILLENED